MAGAMGGLSQPLPPDYEVGLLKLGGALRDNRDMLGLQESTGSGISGVYIYIYVCTWVRVWKTSMHFW